MGRRGCPRGNRVAVSRVHFRTGNLKNGLRSIKASNSTPRTNTEIWSAVTCHRFCRFGDLSPKQGRVQRPEQEMGHPTAFDGDKSPAESADKSAHSKAGLVVGDSLSLRINV